jgi:exopolyphosphatase / guanosine-5'-triphosphate,3'-diphosphate pyrophosphatase
VLREASHTSVEPDGRDGVAGDAVSRLTGGFSTFRAMADVVIQEAGGELAPAGAGGPGTDAESTRSDGGFPTRVAAIDIGSNAIRFLATEFPGPASSQVLHQVRTPVRLGHDVFLTGRLTESGIGAAIEALADYRRLMEELSITRYRAVATSAVRDSDNADAFLDRARAEAGIDIEVITGAEEVRLVHQAVRNRITLGEDRWILVDLGGGSVEVSLVDDRDVLWSVSHGMGSVRLLEELQVAGDEPGRFRRRLEEYAATLRIPTVGRARRAGFIATGGNIETLAKLAGAPPDTNGVCRLGLAQLRSTVEQLARLSYRQRVTELGLREDRADVILPAATVYEQLCEQAGFEVIHVPNVGVKDGIVLDLVDDYARHEPHVERQEQIVFNGAVALGRRFRFDAPHGRHVVGLALSLFDQLEDLHGLPRDDRRILVAGAMLHDVGLFINYRKHHKHSMYIISQSDLPGLNPVEIRMAANVARYHRKGEPAPHHVEYMTLSERERSRVSRLAAIVRIADALDREHLQAVRAVTTRIDDKVVTLELQTSSDGLLEKWAVQRKAALFEKLFDCKVRTLDGRT